MLGVVAVSPPSRPDATMYASPIVLIFSNAVIRDETIEEREHLVQEANELFWIASSRTVV